MRPGDVALFRPHNALGRAVAVFDRSRYCHVRLIVAEDGTTVEADLKGAIEGRVRDGDVIVTAPLTVAQRALIRAHAEALLGTPYGFADIGALALAQFGIRLPSLSRRLDRYDRLFCSQLVDVVWQSVGFAAFDDGRLPQDVTPGDIADHAFTNDWPASTYKENA
ncbi:MAG: hypothetical protein ACTHJM_16105 [Marmoricola sp.]